MSVGSQIFSALLRFGLDLHSTRSVHWGIGDGLRQINITGLTQNVS